jgi:hypothetical protein
MTNTSGVGDGCGVADSEGDDDAPGLVDGEGDGAYVGSTAFTPPPAGSAAPGVVMMNSVSPGNTKPRRRACSSSQALSLASPICCRRCVICSCSAVFSVVSEPTLASSAWLCAASLKMA